MAWFNPPILQTGRVEGLGTAPAYAIDDAATPRRIWKLWTFKLVIPAQAGQARSAQNARRAAPKGRAQRVIQCLCSMLLLRAAARCSSGPLGGDEAGTIRPRSGRCHGGQRLFALAGDGMDARVEVTQE